LITLVSMLARAASQADDGTLGLFFFVASQVAVAFGTDLVVGGWWRWMGLACSVAGGWWFYPYLPLPQLLYQPLWQEGISVSSQFCVMQTYIYTTGISVVGCLRWPPQPSSSAPTSMHDSSSMQVASSPFGQWLSAGHLW
jgi:hypothetical protein